MGFWNIKDLSKYLNIKTSTIYAWTAQGKIPHIKIHGLIRFKSEEIETWLESFRNKLPPEPFKMPTANRYTEDIDSIIDRVKKEVLNGQNRRSSRKLRKKSDDTI